MRLKGHVDKGWGSELIWATNDKYCGKLMNFNRGSRFSMHFHRVKEETWYVQSGKFIVRWILTDTAELREQVLSEGSVWHNPPCFPHQLICIEEGMIIEVSTPDSVDDNYRVLPGDSQVNNFKNISRGSSVEERGTHNPEVVGATPSPASISPNFILGYN